MDNEHHTDDQLDATEIVTMACAVALIVILLLYIVAAM